MKFRQHIEIRRAPADVWPWLVDPERLKRWITHLVEEVRLDDGPVGPGSRTLMRLREGRTVKEYQTVLTRFEPERRLGMEFRGGSFRPDMVMRLDYALWPAPGGTRLDFDGEINLTGGFLAMAPLIWIGGKLNGKRDLKRLKGLCESDATLDP